MAELEPNSPTILSTLGEEIIRIIAPVSVCMLIVVLLVTALSSPSDSPQTLTSIATIAYSESSSDSFWDKLKGAVFNSIAFVIVITAVTFLLVLLFYFRFTNFLKYYMGFSSFTVLAFLGGEIFLLLIGLYRFPIDVVSFLVFLFNFSVVGVMSVFLGKMPIFVTQGYLVVIGVLVAYWFAMLPEWTTWTLLVAMSLYDLAAVLLPVGPLRLLVELAISRDEELPALVYEARPVEALPDSRRGLWAVRNNSGNNFVSHSDNSIERQDLEADPSSNSGPLTEIRDVEANQSSNVNVECRDSESNQSSNSNVSGIQEALPETRLVIVEESSQVQAPLISRQLERSGEEGGEGIGLGSSGAIKLGLGDFIFYSVLVGRASLYDMMTVYACYLAIIAGLGITLLLLAFYRKALPALPVSIMLGLLFYLLARTLLEEFIVQCSTNLLMF